MNNMESKKYSIHLGDLILVNENYPILENMDKSLLVPIDGALEILIHRRVATKLEKLMSEINGWKGIAPVSGWRSQTEQQEIWNSTMIKHGEEFTKKYVARPGCSEHQTGFAIDLGLRINTIDFIRPEFPNSGICRLFSKRAASFGFVLRYPKGKENITNIAWEPWHFRYVGMPHAQIMMEKELVLEEYHLFVKNYYFGQKYFEYEIGNFKFLISYLPEGEAKTLENENFSGIVSGNNIDGFVIMQWEDKRGL